MIHLGKNTKSRIIAKAVSAGKSDSTYRGLVSVHPKATGVRNFTQCDSLLIGKECGSHTIPYIEARNGSAQLEHEATTTRLSDDQLFYASSVGFRRKRPSPCWSTASSATSCRSCRWSSPSRRRSWWRSRRFWRGARASVRRTCPLMQIARPFLLPCLQRSPR
jgi:hypothetical protein